MECQNDIFYKRDYGNALMQMLVLYISNAFTNVGRMKNGKNMKNKCVFYYVFDKENRKKEKKERIEIKSLLYLFN